MREMVQPFPRSQFSYPTLSYFSSPIAGNGSLRLVDVHLRPDRDVVVQPLDILVAQAQATVGRGAADRVLVRRSVQQDAVAGVELVHPERTIDLTVLGTDRRDE